MKKALILPLYSSRRWLEAIELMEDQRLVAMVPGHGAVAKDPNRPIAFMRRYPSYPREMMGAAVEDFIPFDEAYDATDWSEFELLPAFTEANRRNAYQVCLSMEAESLLHPSLRTHFILDKASS